jgi:hypothetical protein
MLKKLAAIGFATSVTFAPLVLAPAAAMDQEGPPVTAPPSREGVITGGTLAKPNVVVTPANSKSANCARFCRQNRDRDSPSAKRLIQSFSLEKSSSDSRFNA